MKKLGRKICFRYAADAVRTRMYRNYRQLRDGWTKNLVLLFPNPGGLAMKSLILGAAPWTALALLPVVRSWWWAAIVVAAFISLTLRIRPANFTWNMEILGGFFGMPMFAYLLLRSKRAHATHRVPWKGRNYTGSIDNRPHGKIAPPNPTTAGRLS